MISQNQIDEILSRINIVDVIGQYVKLKKSGSNYFGLCPFHNEDTASFCVNEAKQIFYCFGCHVGGNAIKFMEEYEHFSFVESVRYLASLCNFTIVEDNNFSDSNKLQKDILHDIYKESAKIYYNSLKNENYKNAYLYYKNRKLTDSTIMHFGLGFAPNEIKYLYEKLKEKNYKDEDIFDSGLVIYKDGKIYDRFRNRVMFPIMNSNNNVIAFGGRVLDDSLPKYLNSQDSLIFDKSKNLYAINFAKKSRENYFILCEGYMDVIALHQAGFTNAVASLGTSLTENQSKLISRYVKNVIISYDSDTAGVNAALRAISILRKNNINVKILNMNPYKDPDEFIKNLGTDEYVKRIKSAKNFFSFQCETIKKDYDLSDPTSKTEYFKKIVELLSEFKEAIERDNYLKSVCFEQHIDEKMLKEMLNNYINNAYNIKNNFKKYTPNNENIEIIENIPIQNQLLNLMIDNINLVNNITKHIDSTYFIGSIYKQIFDEICKININSNLSEQIEQISSKYENNKNFLNVFNKILFNDENDLINKSNPEEIKNNIITLIKKIKIRYFKTLLENENDIKNVIEYNKKVKEIESNIIKL